MTKQAENKQKTFDSQNIVEKWNKTWLFKLSFYFLFLQNSPNSRHCRFPCTLTHTIFLFAYVGYNKRAPLTISSSSQCHIPHIEIILVIMKFESGKPKHQLRFSFNTLLMCTGLLSQLNLRKSLYYTSPTPPTYFFHELYGEELVVVSQKL